MGRGGAQTGGGAADAQIWHLLRGVLPQRQIHRQRGKPARHDSERLGLEGKTRLRKSLSHTIASKLLGKSYRVLTCSHMHL